MRPESWWGPANLPEFWLLLAAGFLWSFQRDRREISALKKA